MHRLIQVWHAGRDRGSTSTEYALVAAFIALAFVIGAIAFGGSVSDFYDSLATALTSHLPVP
jgi:pilus assembly protein Flp/PilA